MLKALQVLVLLCCLAPVAGAGSVLVGVRGGSSIPKVGNSTINP
jgi:hypothetical protein